MSHNAMDAFPAVANFLKSQPSFFPEVEDALALAFEVYKDTGLPDCPETFLTALMDPDDKHDMQQHSLDRMEDDERGVNLAIIKFLTDVLASLR